jgi:hypothetical protein
MITTCSEMHLFNDTFQTSHILFIFNGKVWGIGETEGERERERVRCSTVVKKGCSVGNKLDQSQVIYGGLRDGIYQYEH